MKRATEEENKRCPKCGRIKQQIKESFNDSGTQRCRCKVCGIRYTLEPKRVAYPEEIRQTAIKTYYSGVSRRGVGQIFHMSKSNVYNWIKKLNIPFFARRSRCFPRSPETLKAVVSVFADAYNRFHMAIFKFGLLNPKREFPFGLVDFL